MNRKSLQDGGLSLLAAALVLALLAACAPAAPAPNPAPAAPPPAKAPEPKTSAADFYRDKTVTLVVPYGAGGGTDFGARTLASFWPEVAGGAMIVKNMSAGGGLEGMNYVYGAKPDGLTLVFGITGSQTSPQVFELPGVNYDLTKMALVGDYAPEANGLAVGAGSSHKSMNDLARADGVLFGATSPRGGEAQSAAMAIEFFGLKGAKIVTGYKASPEVNLAIGRGEVHAYTTRAQALKTGVDTKLLKEPFVILDFQRTPIFPNVSAVTELVKLTPQQEAWLRILIATGDQSKMVAGPPAIPEDRVQFLREAFNKLMENKPFVGQMKLRFQGWVGEYRKGEEVADQIQKVLAVPKAEITKYYEVIDRLAK